MTSTERLDTHHKALTLNLDASTFGSFAEIGAGQEVVRWFLFVGGASGTVAKSISAYDKAVSDSLYGTGSRYVSRERLQAMLETEWTQLLGQLDKTRGKDNRFFSFVDTVSYTMTALVNRYTKAPLRFIAGLALLIRAFDDPYFNLEGRLLEALARLLAQNVRIYAYPMTAIDLEQAIKVFSAIDLEWNETRGWVSAEQLRFTPPLEHLYAYLLASSFLIPVRFPAESPDDANHSAPIRADKPAVGEVCGA